MKNLKLFLFFFILISLFSCKTIIVKNKETTGNILFKKLLKVSENINDVYVAGLFKINGVKEIPSVYLQFEAKGKLKDKIVSFKLSSFKTPLIEICLDQDNVVFINHTNNEYINLNLEQVDLSKFTGINFNPLALSYFFLGCIPYSNSMELMDFNWNSKEYILNSTDKDSIFNIHLNENEEIAYVKIVNQFFDTIILDSIKYKKNNLGNNIPYMITLSAEGKTTQFSFIINKTSLLPINKSLFDLKILTKYNKITNIDKIKINFQKK